MSWSYEVVYKATPSNIQNFDAAAYAAITVGQTYSTVAIAEATFKACFTFSGLASPEVTANGTIGSWFNTSIPLTTTYSLFSESIIRTPVADQVDPNPDTWYAAAADPSWLDAFLGPQTNSSLVAILPDLFSDIPSIDPSAIGVFLQVPFAFTQVGTSTPVYHAITGSGSDIADIVVPAILLSGTSSGSDPGTDTPVDGGEIITIEPPTVVTIPTLPDPPTGMIIPVWESQGFKLPLPTQTFTTLANRLQRGNITGILNANITQIAWFLSVLADNGTTDYLDLVIDLNGYQLLNLVETSDADSIVRLP